MSEGGVNGVIAEWLVSVIDELGDPGSVNQGAVELGRTATGLHDSLHSVRQLAVAENWTGSAADAHRAAWEEHSAAVQDLARQVEIARGTTVQHEAQWRRIVKTIIGLILMVIELLAIGYALTVLFSWLAKLIWARVGMLVSSIGRFLRLFRTVMRNFALRMERLGTSVAKTSPRLGSAITRTGTLSEKAVVELVPLYGFRAYPGFLLADAATKKMSGRDINWGESAWQTAAFSGLDGSLQLGWEVIESTARGAAIKRFVTGQPARKVNTVLPGSTRDGRSSPVPVEAADNVSTSPTRSSATTDLEKPQRSAAAADPEQTWNDAASTASTRVDTSPVSRAPTFTESLSISRADTLTDDMITRVNTPAASRAASVHRVDSFDNVITAANSPASLSRVGTREAEPLLTRADPAAAPAPVPVRNEPLRPAAVHSETPVPPATRADPPPVRTETPPPVRTETPPPVAARAETPPAAVRSDTAAPASVEVRPPVARPEATAPTPSGTPTPSLATIRAETPVPAPAPAELPAQPPVRADPPTAAETIGGPRAEAEQPRPLRHNTLQTVPESMPLEVHAPLPQRGDPPSLSSQPSSTAEGTAKVPEMKPADAELAHDARPPSPERESRRESASATKREALWEGIKEGLNTGIGGTSVMGMAAQANGTHPSALEFGLSFGLGVSLAGARQGLFESMAFGRNLVYAPTPRWLPRVPDLPPIHPPVKGTMADPKFTALIPVAWTYYGIYFIVQDAIKQGVLHHRPPPTQLTPYDPQAPK